MNNKKNPYAFPCVDDEYLQEGMTLRDYFAAKAMQGVISDSKVLEATIHNAIDLGVPKWNYIASGAYRLADAMLEERNKKKDE